MHCPTRDPGKTMHAHSFRSEYETNLCRRRALVDADYNSVMAARFRRVPRSFVANGRSPEPSCCTRRTGQRLWLSAHAWSLYEPIRYQELGDENASASRSNYNKTLTEFNLVMTSCVRAVVLGNFGGKVGQMVLNARENKAISR